MSKICRCCGAEVVLSNIALDYFTFGVICKNCKKNIEAYSRGELLLEDVITEETNRDVIGYIESLDVKGSEEEVITEKRRIEKKEKAKLNDPLYDDIHQIAGDLRFMKNLIILGIVCTFIFALIGTISIL